MAIARRPRWLFAFATVASLAVGCRPAPRAARPLPGTEPNHEAPLLTGERVKLVSTPGLPALQLVRREGDPSGALALAVFPPGGTAGTLHMAALVNQRLSKATVKHQLQAHGLGFVLVREADDADDAASWVRAVHAALNDKVTEVDIKAMGELPLLKAAAARADSLSPFGLCMGALGAEGADALREAVEAASASSSFQSFIEELRVETATAARVGLAALGSPDLLQAVEQAHDAEWDAGEPLDDSWVAEEQTAVATSQGAQEIRLALRVADSEAALAGARALRDPAHPLHARLRSLSPHLSADDVRVTLRPAGACVGLSISFEGETEPKLERVAAAGLLAKEELAATVRQGASGDEHRVAILAPQGAEESVALAAWTAVRSSRVGGGPQEILEFRSTTAQSLTHQAVSQALANTSKAWQERKLPTSVRVESGQSEFWLLVASPCGTAPEAADEAGLRALTVSTLARNFTGTFGVQLQPWVSPRGVGLFAHSPIRPGEDVAQHAERVARAVASAYSGAALDGRVLAATRTQQLTRVGSNPADELAVNILGKGHPTGAYPWGLGKSVATLSVADVERSRADLTQEPLQLAIIATAEAAQAEAAQRALERWLAPAREHTTTCPAEGADSIPPGTWDIETSDEELSPGALIVVDAPASPVIGNAVAYLLNRRGGYLDRAFSSPDLAANVSAEFWGNAAVGGLILRIQAEAEQLERATHQARALLRDLASGAVAQGDTRLAVERHETLERRRRRTQRGRIVELFEETRPDPLAPGVVSTAGLNQFLKKLGPDQHRVITLRVRK